MNGERSLRLLSAQDAPLVFGPVRILVATADGDHPEDAVGHVLERHASAQPYGVKRRLPV